MFSPGSFEFIEAKIREVAADTTQHGFEFEKLCKWYFFKAPRYRGQFEKVYLWKDWPDRWGGDAGIDLVALHRSGALWAIQAKCYAPDYYVKKSDIDSFVSESSRSKFKHRVLVCTTDKIGATPRRVLDDLHVSVIGRRELLTEALVWPEEIGGKGKRAEPYSPRPHQSAAIAAVTDGLRASSRGRLTMACGTGKSLTAMWVAERLESRRTLVLVPSLSLVSQALSDWGQHAQEEFDYLVVCSDATVSERRGDVATQSVSALGVDVTTDPAEIKSFLTRRRQRPAVVFSTYQSSVRVAAAQAGIRRPFDLAICDEAHRLAGRSASDYVAVLHDDKIRARKRLFMTATPRYIKEHVKRRAADLDYELVSMDDEDVFGPELHTLTFHEAITASPPLLTDYQVAVIGVTDSEAREWVEEGAFVRTGEGLETDARSLAARIGLAKAMKKFNLRRVISFHSSVAKAKGFASEDGNDSFAVVARSLSKSSRPTGKLWTRHISGRTPADQRLSVLRGLGDLPSRTRGVVSNCACLGEGVDVPVLDGVAFIDPKRSMVDIIQAVGRVIRKAEGKEIGTIVIPVLIEESQNPDDALSNSTFEPVWQVLKALRAHDSRLADELDQLRLSLGRRGSRRVRLPEKIHLNVPRRLLRGFSEAFYVRTVLKTTPKADLSTEQILEWADEHFRRTGEWPTQYSGQVDGVDESWSGIHAALGRGRRGLPGGDSLAQLLARRRDYRNVRDLPELTVEQILTWAEAHRERTGKWPGRKSGSIHGTSETWSRIHDSLRLGHRGVAGYSSLAHLLAEERGHVNPWERPDLTIEQILEWADKHKARTGQFPTVGSGNVKGTDEDWARISDVLRRGTRGLPGGITLAQLLAERRNHYGRLHRPELSVQQILKWVDEYKTRTGSWPNLNSGDIAETEETWRGIDRALQRGSRNLPGGDTLAQLLANHRGIRNALSLPELEVSQILTWADAHRERSGKWPQRDSGPIDGTNETWGGVNAALARGKRGFLGGSSLSQLLAEHRDHRNVRRLPKLSVEQILIWAIQHRRRTGRWPGQYSGVLECADETWAGINAALARGQRGLPGGSSLAKLLAEHRAESQRSKGAD